ncbi:MAG: translocation/assembly module TamB domain-containing protein [Boseongicola sp.]
MRHFAFLLIILSLVSASPTFAQEKLGWIDRIFGATQEEETEDDPGSYLESLIEENLSGDGRNVEITGFQGVLSGRATLESLTIADAEGVWLTLSDVVLDWNRGALLRGRIEVAELSAETILFPRLPKPAENSTPSPEATGFSLPELPVSIAIGKVEAAKVEIGEPVFGAVTVASANGALILDGGEGSADLLIRRLDGVGELVLDTSYSNSDQVLSLDLELVEDRDGILANMVDLPGRPALEFSIKGEAPIDEYAADIRLETNGSERLAGRVATTVPAAESGATLTIAAEIEGDISPVFRPDYQPFFGPNVSLRTSLTTFADGRITVDDLAISADALTLTGQIDIAATGLPEQIDITGKIATLGGEAVLLPLTGPETRVGRVDLRVGFDAEAGEPWTGEFRISGLERAGFSAETLVLSGNGRIREAAPREVTAALKFDATALDLGSAKAEAALGEQVNGSVDVSWTEGAPIKLDSFLITGESYELDGGAAITFRENGPNIEGQAEFGASNLSSFSGLAGHPLDGSASLRTIFDAAPFAGTFEVTAEGQTRDLKVSQPEADRILAGVAEISLSALRDETGLTMSIQRLRTPNAELTGHADLRTGASSLSFDARLANAELILPQMSGPIVIDADTRQIDLRNWAVEFGIDGETLKLAAKGLVLDPFEKLAIEGTLLANISDLSEFAELARRPISGALKLEAAGAAAFDLSSFNIIGGASGQNLKIGMPDLDQLLEGGFTTSFDVAKADEKIDVAALKIESDFFGITANGALGTEDSVLSAYARLDDVSPFVPEFSGPLMAEGNITQPFKGQYNFDAEAVGPGGVTARISGNSAADFSAVDMSVSGVAPLGLANRFIQPRSLSGSAQFEVSVDGPPTLASVSGQITSSGARFVAPALGATFEDIALNVTMTGARANVSVSAAASTGGRISVAGPIELVSPFTADLGAELSRFLLTNPRLYETTVSGRVTVSGPLLNGAFISGDLELGETNIRIPSTGLGGTGDIPEVVHMNEPPPVRGTRRRAGLLETAGKSATGPSFPLDVRINAPNRVFVRGRGLDSEFGGGLRVTGTTREVTPIGAFNLIRGRLDILGQRLEIEEATITIQGSFVPIVRIRATTQVEDTTINIIVLGPADNPEISFESQPELPEEEVLARLIFGRGMETLSPLQAARLALAVRTLAGRGGEGIVGNIRQGAGLADFDVTTDDEGNPAVRAGAYLSENVYTDLNVRADGETRLNLNLDVTPSITLKGSASNSGDTSIGVFFERDY